MIKLFKLDPHSLVHFVGCYALVPTIMLFGVGLGVAGVIAFCLGVLWEMADEVYKAQREDNDKLKLDWLFDPRGADVVDMLVDAAGALLAVVVFGIGGA